MANILVYYMFLFKMPGKIVKVLEKKKDFLWEGGRKKKMHLVNWEVACHPKEERGLRVGRLKDRNVALLSKWIWRFSYEAGSLWHSIISSKYGSHSNGWDVNLTPKSSMSLLWRNFITHYPKIAHFLRFVVGNGRNIRFWTDIWWSDQCLATSFPILFRLACLKEAKVSEVISYSSSGISWILPLSRNLHDWELERMCSLMCSLNEVFLSPSFEDKRV